MLVELKTCSTICGAHVQTILNHKDLTGSAVGVREGQNTEQYGAIWGILGPESQFWQKLAFLAVFADFLLPHLVVTLGILRHAMLNKDPCT